MTGHSKWAKIKRRKGAQDAKRAKVFARILNQILANMTENCDLI
jgi:transcriptional/translational regulatory protein YebC/TACO1